MITNTSVTNLTQSVRVYLKVCGAWGLFQEPPWGLEMHLNAFKSLFALYSPYNESRLLLHTPWGLPLKFIFLHVKCIESV